MIKLDGEFPTGIIFLRRFPRRRFCHTGVEAIGLLISSSLSPLYATSFSRKANVWIWQTCLNFSSFFLQFDVVFIHWCRELIQVPPNQMLQISCHIVSPHQIELIISSGVGGSGWRNLFFVLYRWIPVENSGPYLMKLTFETIKFTKILGGNCQNVLFFRNLLPNDVVEIMDFAKKGRAWQNWK